MSKIFLMCGKICSGKSTCAKQLSREHKAVILSIDDIMLALFGQDAGEKHDHYVEMTEKYLYEKSLEILELGINVVLDWGFWTREKRDYARNFYGPRGIEHEFCYISISDEEWNRRLDKRNKDVKENRSDAYYVDEGLRRKFEAIFEAPENEEKVIRM